MTTRRPTRAALVLTAVAALAACGTTVPVSSQVQAGGAGLGGGAVDGSVPGTAVDPLTGVTTGGSTGATTGGPTGTTATSGTSGVPVPVGGSSSRPAPGPAVAAPTTRSPVEIGIVIFPDVNAAAAMFGGSAAVGDQRGQVETAIAWINTHGGLNGHKLVPVIFEVELTSTQTYAVTYEEICSSFTEDHKVVAAILIANVEPALPTCLAKGGSLFLGHGRYLRDAADYRQLQRTITPEDAGSDRVARAIGEQLLSRGMVKRGEKLGLLVMDYGGPRRGRDEVLEPMMKQAGVTVVDYEIPYPQSTQAIANSAAAVQNAQLRMAAEGVKTVTFLCPGCATFFLQYADSQAYYPAYLMTSYDTFTGYKGKSESSRSLQKAVGLGWDPIRDVGTYSQPRWQAGNATHDLCRTVEKAHIKDDMTNFSSQAFCGALMDLQAAARANPVTPLTADSLLAGFESFGTRHESAGNFATSLSRDRHDGTAAYRTLRYDSETLAFVYDGSPLRPLL